MASPRLRTEPSTAADTRGDGHTCRGALVARWRFGLLRRGGCPGKVRSTGQPGGRQPGPIRVATLLAVPPRQPARPLAFEAAQINWSQAAVQAARLAGVRL